MWHANFHIPSSTKLKKNYRYGSNVVITEYEHGIILKYVVVVYQWAAMFAQGDWLPLWEQGKDEVPLYFVFWTLN